MTARPAGHQEAPPQDGHEKDKPRLITLRLLARALRATGADPSDRDIARLPLPQFGKEQTKARVQESFGYLARLVREWKTDVRPNARGRALYPTDLLKAFHPREIGSGLRDAAAKREVVELWEDIPAAHVNALFSEYLFKIRRWSGGRDVLKEGFTTSDIGMFKGIREHDVTNSENNWARPFVYAKNFTEDYRSENSTLVRFGMLEPIEYPHQIDQPVLNGETFFRMVSHYYQLGVRLGLLAFSDDRLPKERQPKLGESRSPAAAAIDQRSRSGGRYAYIRGLLDALLYYHDRFGAQERDRFASLAARYVMVPRARHYAVRPETVNEYALGRRRDLTSINLFQEVRDAGSAREVLNRDIPPACPVRQRPVTAQQGRRCGRRSALEPEAGCADVTGQPQFVPVRDLFDGSRRFRIPIYQRAYAWGKVEIETLIRDIASVLDKPAYYIGSLVLHEVRDIESDQPVFDVIDGQQRLTTLFITLTHPDLRPYLRELTPSFSISDRLLSFEERKRSNLDLAALARAQPSALAIKSLQDDGIKAGAELVANLLSDEARLEKMLLDPGVRWSDPTGAGLTKSVLSYLLDRVQIVLTELPPDTDLNHYFEVMNTRGEQLEKHEIVKAHLLSKIGDDEDGRALFSAIWDACSDFTCHVQARFEPSDRSAIFGHPAQLGDEAWSTFLPAGPDDLSGLFSPTHNAVQTADLDLDSLLDSFGSESPTRPTEGPGDDGDTGRYGAIIDFPNFLLHVLRLHSGGDHGISLDDKKLVAQFERTITSSSAALDFAYRLLRAKFLFDNFIIKPLDEPGGSDDSNWVIHRPHYTRPDTKAKARSEKLSPRNAFADLTQQVLMLQAMYQVTYQQRVYKEFLYQLIEYLDARWAEDSSIDGREFIRRIHQMANSHLAELDVRNNGNLDTGTGVPHFVFNILDYKLWWLSEIEKRPHEGLSTVKASGFRFAYRTSIEHFLPSNLAESEDQQAVVNRFGNLCLMTRTENSRRSDHTPDWKVEKYGYSDQSLKFHYMAALQRQAKEWGPHQIVSQGDAMRNVLFTSLPS